MTTASVLHASGDPALGSSIRLIANRARLPATDEVIASLDTDAGSPGRLEP
jgi:hypothetical protein